MEYLMDVLRDYVQYSKPLNKVLKQKTKQLEPGDVVAIYGDDIAYGVVLEQVGDWYNVIYLTTSLVLGGAGYKVILNHIMDAAKVTPINFYVKPEHCDVVKKLTGREFARVVRSYKKLSNRQYMGIWKQFYSFEAQRLQVLYDMFMSDVINR